MNGKVGLGLGIVAGASVIGALLYLALAPVEVADLSSPAVDGEVSAKSPGDRKASRLTTKAKAGQAKSKRPPKAKYVPKMTAPKDWFEKLPTKDRAIAKRIQDAQDANDQAAVLAAADEALKSGNDEVRQAAVDALSLQGEAAIPHLLGFLTDRNADVSDSAYHAWDDAVDCVDGDLNKLAAIKQAIGVDKNGEHIASAVSKIEMFDQSRAIRELAKLAMEDGTAAEAAIESYENVTGEPFESWAAAELKAMAIDRANREQSSVD